MRLVTFNVRHGAADDGLFSWQYRREGLLDLLQRLDADIYCLQEALDFQLREVAAALAGYSWVGAGRDDGHAAGEYAPIFVRGLKPSRSDTFWLSPFPDIPGTIGWGARHARICTWAEVDGLIVANVHLDHESIEARIEGMAVVLSRITCPAILCGDFNADPDEISVAGLLAAGFQDLSYGTGGTYNGFSPDLGAAQRIDYVFGQGVRGTRAEVVREPLVSDHWPVVVDFDA